MRDDVNRPGYEVTDVKPRGIIIFLIGLAVLTLILVVSLRAIFSMLEARAVRHDRVEPVPVEREAALRGDRHPLEPPPDPLLQANPEDALAAMRAQETRILTTYGWVSREAGVARIPIDRAMELVLERGLPARTASSTNDSSDAIPRDSNSGRPSVPR